jgi:hypothetical protein
MRMTSDPLADIDVVLRLKSELADAHYLRGLINQAKGDVAGAVANYRIAVELQPAHKQAQAAREFLAAHAT